MAAELRQREKIITFCKQHGIAVPSFTSTLDLTRCIAASLSVLDGGADGRGSRVEHLTERRDALRAELNASIVEGAQLEEEIAASKDSHLALEALQLLMHIERIADEALRPAKVPRAT